MCADSSTDTTTDKNWQKGEKQNEKNHVSRVTCQVSRVRCQVSHVMCQVSGVRRPASGIRCQVSGVKCQVSCAMCDTCHQSTVACHGPGRSPTFFANSYLLDNKFPQRNKRGLITTKMPIFFCKAQKSFPKQTYSVTMKWRFLTMSRTHSSP